MRLKLFLPMLLNYLYMYSPMLSFLRIAKIRMPSTFMSLLREVIIQILALVGAYLYAVYLMLNKDWCINIFIPY